MSVPLERDFKLFGELIGLDDTVSQRNGKARCLEFSQDRMLCFVEPNYANDCIAISELPIEERAVVLGTAVMTPSTVE